MASKTGVLVIVVVVLLAGFTGGFTVASLADTETVGMSVSVDEAPATETPATPSKVGQNTTPTATPNGTATATPSTTETPNGTATATPSTTETPNGTAIDSSTATETTPAE
ncbi:hypothetical protein B4589_011830 [Halolamina sp. CBA1230]|uniref:hypothetical protein n=1 Tax=Halolamina sp. CBA1230 TaxID=1853690 RepID=UPI001179FE53|nr:hypothetical protein [Halolamina sp. CBA1230]QKY21031.1 hypothetical protein B4589_011830 [Halolamina sp. CBA1230]